MPTDIYIFGTNHALQCGTDKYSESSISLFQLELESICGKFNIARISEEISAEGLREHGVKNTVAQRLFESDLTYQQLDLSTQERESLSLADSTVLAVTRSFHLEYDGLFRERFDDLVSAIRERVWVARILSKEDWPVLLICGSNHAVSLRRICRSLGMDSKMLHFDYGP